MTDGIYQMQVLVTDHAGNTTTSPLVANVKIDNTPPVTAQDDPGAFLRGTIALTGTAADPLDPQNQPGSGVDHVDFQVSPTGANTWTTVGTATTAPYSVSLDTTTLTDGHYDFRTVATDVAGNQSTATPVTNRLVDNTPPVVQLNDPGANLRGTIALSTNPAGTNDPGANASGIVSTDLRRLRRRRRDLAAGRSELEHDRRPPTASTTSAQPSRTPPATSAPRASSAPAASTTPLR